MLLQNSFDPQFCHGDLQPCEAWHGNTVICCKTTLLSHMRVLKCVATELF